TERTERRRGRKGVASRTSPSSPSSPSARPSYLPALSTLFLPAFLATYSAASAWAGSSLSVRPVSGQAAAPKEALRGQERPFQSHGVVPSLIRIRSAIRAPVPRSAFGSQTADAPPPV